MAAPESPQQPGLRWEVLIPLALLALVGAYSVYQLVLLQVTSIVTPPKTETPVATMVEPDDLKPKDYTHYGRKEEPVPVIPTAQYVKKDPVASQDGTQTIAVAAMMQQMQASAQAMQAQTGMIERMLSALLLTQQGGQSARQEPTRNGTGSGGQQGTAPAKPRGPIKLLIDNTAGEGKIEEKTKEGDEGKDLIRRAKWAIPEKPRLTLYRSMQLPARTLDAIVSEIAGQVRLELTVPIFDRIERETMILPKGSIIVAMQEGSGISYGQNRIPLRLEQIELPTGEVISLKASVGDSNGAQGLTGKVDNKIGKLILATGLSALLNIGVRTATGTPGQGQFFQTPLQSASQDIGQSIQRDAQSIIDRELRVKPVVTIPAQTIATINLLENYQFNHRPTIVR